MRTKMHFTKILYVIFYITIVHVLYRQKVNGSYLLNSYLPASMQALAYYIDLLQYEPLSTTTVDPPFYGNVGQDNDIAGSSTSARPPSTTTSGWWVPPTWWTPLATTVNPIQETTPAHRPALYAPESTSRLKFPAEGYDIFHELCRTPEGFNNLPLSLIEDIKREINHDDFNNDVESLDNFLRIYDDNYGQATFDIDLEMDRWSTTSTAGKKRVPPTKPYVEFLLVYDLLKRDAKSSNLSKYEGYSDELLKDLNELSHMSSQRQLYILFKRMLERGDIQRSDVVSRIQAIVNDLGNPNSATVKALRYIPAMPFLP